jgi:hypothetical protein
MSCYSSQSPLRFPSEWPKINKASCQILQHDKLILQRKVRTIHDLRNPLSCNYNCPSFVDSFSCCWLLLGHQTTSRDDDPWDRSCFCAYQPGIWLALSDNFTSIMAPKTTQCSTGLSMFIHSILRRKARLYRPVAQNHIRTDPCAARSNNMHLLEGLQEDSSKIFTVIS